MIIGIDVSKASFDCDWMTDGKAIHQVFNYTEAGIDELLTLTTEDAHYVMEATGVYHTRLALQLHEAGRQVSVVNPLVIKRFIQIIVWLLKCVPAELLNYNSFKSPP